MASVAKIKNSKYYRAYWRGIDGKQINRSTKVKISEGKKKAQEIADEMEDVYRGKKDKVKIRNAISTIHEKYNGDTLKPPSFNDFQKAFLDYKKSSVGVGSILKYKTSFRYFSDFLGNKANDGMDTITEYDIDRFKNSLSNRLSQSTVAGHIKSIKALFALSLQREEIEKTPFNGIKISRKSSSTLGTNHKRAFTMDELEILVNGLKGEWRSLVIFAVYTGQRLGDLATLKWSAIDIDNNKFSIVTSKTNRQVKMFLNSSLRKHIEEILPNKKTDYVHPNLAQKYLQNRHKTGSNGLSGAFSRHLAKLGLKEEYDLSHGRGGNKKNGRSGKRVISQLCFHSLRVTAITFLHELNVPMAIVQNWVGHDCPEIHQIYIKMGDDALRKASNAIPDIGV